MKGEHRAKQNTLRIGGAIFALYEKFLPDWTILTLFLINDFDIIF